jgi:molybdenum cofactor guanylyltransferase
MCAAADDTLVAILAGGAGARVGGADKGLLPLCGKPLIEHVVDRLRPQGTRLLIVANRNPDSYARFAPVVHDAGEGHAGPLAGLVAIFDFIVANRHALPRWLLTAPVDCPDPPRDLAVRLRVALTENARARCARLAPAGKPEPMFAMYRIGEEPEAWLVSVRAALREHGSVMRWQAAFDPVAVDGGEVARALHNLNTPEDFEEYERSHAAR